ncbi:hypothetical protein AgCh_005239 [Apium graveolens]
MVRFQLKKFGDVRVINTRKLVMRYGLDKCSYVEGEAPKGQEVQSLSNIDSVARGKQEHLHPYPVSLASYREAIHFALFDTERNKSSQSKSEPKMPSKYHKWFPGRNTVNGDQQ